MRTPRTKAAWVAAWSLVASALWPAATWAVITPIYLVSGAVDSTTAATVIHCSNLSAQSVNVWLEVFGPTGTQVCGVGVAVASGRTATLATRDTQLFVESGTCEFLPLIGRGMARIGLESNARVVCTAQLVDPAHATPLYLVRLPLYDDEGVAKSLWLFADGFETTNTSRWSAVSP